MVLQNLGQMRGQNRARIDDGVTAERCFLAQTLIDPGRGKPERRLVGMDAGKFDGLAFGIHQQKLAGVQFTASSRQFFDADRIFIGPQLHIVQDTDGRHHEAHFGRELTPQSLDLVGDAVSLRVIDER